MTIRDFSVLLIPESGPSDQDDDHLALIDKWVIGSIIDICTEWNWDALRTSEQITSVAAQAEYSLQATGSNIISVRTPVDERQIDPTTEEELIRYGYDLEQQNDTTLYYYPSGYDTATKKNKIKFYPVPSTNTIVYEVEEKKRLDGLVAASDCPLPVEFNELIMAGARIRIFQHNLKYQMMIYWDAKYREKLQMLKGTQSRNLDSRIIRRVSDIDDYRPIGPRLDPAHYRNER